MKVKLLKDCQGEKGPLRKGQIIDHPNAGRLLEMGIAHPVDMPAIRHHRDHCRKIADQFEAASSTPSAPPAAPAVSPVEPPPAPVEPVPVPAPPPPPPVEEESGDDLEEAFEESAVE